MKKPLPLNLFNEEEKSELFKKIISFFQDERNEQIGIIAAEQVLDFFLKEVAKPLYNKGIEDAAKLLSERLGSMEVDLEALKKE